MTRAPDNRPHTTVAFFGPSGHGSAALRRRLAAALLREPGARAAPPARDDRLRFELPARWLELVDQPPPGAPLEELARAALGADVVVFVVAPRGYDEAELTTLIRLTLAYRGAPLLLLHDDDGVYTPAERDRGELELRAAFTAHDIDGDALPCIRASAPDAMTRLAGRLLHDTPVKPPGTERFTVAELLDRQPRPEWRDDELELWVYLAQGSIRRGDTLAVARARFVAEFVVESIEVGDTPERVGAARHARLRARFPDGLPYDQQFDRSVILSPEIAARNPWSQVFELNLTFFEHTFDYPKPAPGKIEAAIACVFAHGLEVGGPIFGVEGGEGYGGRYDWRVRMETLEPFILVRGTRFYFPAPTSISPGAPLKIIAAGVVRRALAEPQTTFPEPISWEWEDGDLLGVIFCD